jgi:hypothetical protein
MTKAAELEDMQHVASEGDLLAERSPVKQLVPVLDTAFLDFQELSLN